MFFLVVAMLLCRGVSYAYSPSANDPISKSGGIEQDIPPPHIPPPPLPSQIFLHVGEISETPYPMIGAMVCLPNGGWPGLSGLYHFIST